MRYFFNILRLSKIEKTIESKSNVFLSQFAIIAVTAAIISMVHDVFFESWQTALIDLFIVIIFIICYSLNERKYHIPAKLIFTIAGPGIIFFYAAVIPRDSGIYFYFFPIITITFLLFDRNDDVYKYAAIAYALTLLFILELYDYQPFGKPLYSDIASESSYKVNLIVSIFTTVMSLVSFDNLNKLVEKKRNEAMKLFESKNAELIATNDELDKFVYSASHDLKAPLLSILGLINIAKYEIKDKLTLEYFDRIKQRIEKLNQFIKEVIAISRNSRTEVIPEILALKELVEEIFDSNNYIEGINSIVIDCEIDPNLKVKIDKSRLEIILNNLISNAIKYRKNFDTHEIKIGASIEDNHLKFMISDNGVGIEEHKTAKVFDMFYRGHEESEGSGLGLYIVKTTVEKLNGAIQLKSVYGEGTTIHLSIPLSN